MPDLASAQSSVLQTNVPDSTVPKESATQPLPEPPSDKASVTPVAPSRSSRISLSIIFLIVLIFLLFILNILQFLRIIPNKTTRTTTLQLPIDYSNKNVSSYGIVYYFETTIEEIKDISGNTELITNIKDPQIPKFILDQNTNIYSKTTANNDFELKKISDLKVGQKVGVRVNYHSGVTPSVTRVTILR